MSKQFYFKQFSLAKVQFSSIWPIDRTLSGATTPGQSGPGSYGNERVLRIPQSSSISGTSPPDCFVSYPGQSLGEGLTPSAEMQLVHSVVPGDRASGSLDGLHSPSYFYVLQFLLVTVPSAPITIGIIITFMIHIFFSVLSQGIGIYLSFSLPSVLPCGQPER